MFPRCSLLPLALTAALPAFATEIPRYEGETTVITATRAPRDPSQLASDVTVITAEDIAKSSATDLPSLLARQSGIGMVQSGGIGQTSSLFLRGTNSNHTQLLIDGQRVSSATTGTATWQLIPLELIDRIEIVRGGASGAYGADAIGGVIQVFTKRGGGKPHAMASVEYGSYGHTATSAGISGSSGNLRYQFTARASDDGGINATTPGHSMYEVDRDGHRNAGFSGNLAYFINDNHEVGAQLLYSNSRTEFDSGGNNPDFAFGGYLKSPITQNRLLTYSAYTRNTWLPGWESTLRVGESRDWSKADGWDWNSYTAGVDRFETRQQQASWSNRLNSSWGSWLLGVEALEDTVRSNTNYDKTSRRTNAAFGGWSQTFGIHSLQANLRHDHSSQFGGFNSGNLGYSLEIVKGLRSYANIGKAYHAPTFNDLYYPASMWFSPNPNLKPEKARTAEVGIKAQIKNWHVNLALFDTRISDMIASTGSTMENIGISRIKGATLSAEGKFSSLDTSFNITWQDPRNLDTNKLLARRARVLGSAKAGYRIFGDWRLFGELEGQSSRFEAASNTPASRMHGYILTHLGVDYRLTKNWKTTLRVNNIFDQHYALAKDYATPYADYAAMRRNAMLKLTWNGNL